MKDLITTVAAITILMVFVMQFSANQVIMGRILSADKAVDKYVSILESQGYTDEQQKDHLMMKLSETMNCRKSEVIIREEGGEYRISAPLKNIVACSKFWEYRKERTERPIRWEEIICEEPHYNYSYRNIDEYAQCFPAPVL